MWWTRTLICKTLLSPLSVRACLISAWGTNTFSRKWMWRPTEEGDNWDTWEPLCSDSELPTPERKQTVAPLHREVRAPTDKVKCLSNRLSLNNQHRRLFWYKQQPIQFKHFGKYWAFSIWQRQRCEEPSVFFFFGDDKGSPALSALFLDFNWANEEILSLENTSPLQLEV